MSNCDDNQFTLIPPHIASQLMMKVGAPREFVYGNGRSNLDYDSDDEPLLPPVYDSDDEPLVYDSDDEPLVYADYETADDDGDDEPLMTAEQMLVLKTADFNLLEKEKTRKATQQRAKFLMDKYNFKIKGWYNMKRDDIIRECFRQL